MTRIVVVHKDQVEGYGYQLYRKTSNILRWQEKSAALERKLMN